MAKPQQQPVRELTADEIAAPVTKATFWRRVALYVQQFSVQNPPVVKGETPEFAAWHQYFVRHLGDVPWIAKDIIAGTRTEMTMPTLVPSWFDNSYVEDPEWVAPRKAEIVATPAPVIVANVFVCEGAPQYGTVLLLHETTEASPAWFETRVCGDGVSRRGIWVPHGWMPEKRKRAGSFKMPPRTALPPRHDAQIDEPTPFDDAPIAHPEEAAA